MPKEIVPFNSFNGAAPAIPDAPGGAVSFWNARVDGSLNTAVPENNDKAVGTAYIQQKNLFVEGKDIAVSEDINGHVYVDGVRVGTISPPTGDRPCMDVIGRQMSIIQDSGHTKYLRYGYSKGDLIGVDRNDIIFEEDVISSKYGYSTIANIQFVVPINDNFFLYAQYGYSNLFIYDIQENVTYSSYPLAPTLPEAWSYDMEKVGDIWYPKYIYFAYYRENELYISKLNLGQVFSTSGFNPEALETISVESSTILANVKVIETNKPVGSKLDSIAVSKDFVFLGYNMGANNPLSHMEIEDDVLFSFSKDFFVYNQPATVVSCADNTLNRSKLPFMPYQKMPSRHYYVNTAHRVEGTEEAPTYYRIYWDSDLDNPNPEGFFKIPHEAMYNSQALVNQEPNDLIDTECGFFDLFQRLEQIYLTQEITNPNEGGNFITLPSQVTKIYSPGYCGFAHVVDNEPDDVLLVGSLIIVDYTNNIVGYEIACPTKIWLNKHLGYETESVASDYNIRNNIQQHNGCGLAYWQHTNYYSSSANAYYNLNTIWSMPLSMLTKNQEEVVFDSGTIPQDVYYCWNGVQPTRIWDYELFDIPLDYDTPAPHQYYRRIFHLTKYFNNEEVNSDGSSRFAIFASDLASFPSDHYNQRTHYSLLAGDSKTILTPSRNSLFYFSPSGVDYSEEYSYISLPVGEIEGSLSTPNNYRVFSISHSEMAFAYENNIILNNVVKFNPPVIELESIGELQFQQEILTFEDISGSGFEPGKIIRYRLAFVYDGLCISPLTDVSWDHTVTGSDTQNIIVTVNINITMLHLVSRRITAVRLYAAEILEGTEQELFRLVKEIELDIHGFSLDPNSGLYTARVFDDGTRYASFNIDAGYSETMKNVSARRKCQCLYNGMIFAGNVYFPLDTNVNVNTNNLVIRSLPYQPSIFNYQEEYCVLGFIPNVLIPYNGRIYAFGKEEYSIINADTLAIEYTSKSCGALQRSHVVATETGIFVYFNGNLYIVDGNKVVPIGEAIKENNYSQLSIEGTAFPSFKWLTGRVYVEYIQNRNAIAVIGETVGETVDAPGKYQQIIAFVYGISTGRWATYMIETPDAYDAYLKGVYSTEDGSAIVTVSTDIETLESPSIPILPPIIPPETKAVSTIPGILVRTISYNNGRYLTTYAISQKLFGSDVSTYTSRVRTMELDYVTDFGIKNKKQIYDIQTYNGNTRVQSEIYIDNKKASEYYGKPVQKSVFHISIESQEPISVIRYVIRSFVTKEEI